MKRKSFIKKSKSFFKNYGTIIIIISSFVIGAIIGGVMSYNYSKPTKFTKEQINTYTILANDIWAYGAKSIDGEFDDIDIQILSNSEICISSSDRNKEHIHFYFSKHALEKVTTTPASSNAEHIAIIVFGSIAGALSGFAFLLFISLVIDGLQKIKKPQKK